MAFKLRPHQTVYTLMNKTYPVASFAYDLELHAAVKVLEVIDPAHAPLSLFDGRGEITRRTFNRWWSTRTVPASRRHIRELMDRFYLESLLELAERSLGLSLSDRYWVVDGSHPLRWEDVNFFDNDFSDELGMLTIGGRSESPEVDLLNPNSTVGGDLLKKWAILDGERMLVKAGSGLFNQEPYNEFAATRLFERLLGPDEFVPYRLLEEHGRAYSICPEMLGPDEELVPAYDIVANRKWKSGPGEVDRLSGVYESLGIRDARLALDKMLACDFLLANTDRHFRNFGVIRNVETLEFTRAASLFDTGRSLWCDQPVLEAPADFEYAAKPFGVNGTPSSRVPALVSDLSWLDFGSIEGFADEVAGILGDNPLMPSPRIDAIKEGIERNARALSARAAELGSAGDRDLERAWEAADAVNQTLRRTRLAGEPKRGSAR